VTRTTSEPSAPGHSLDLLRLAIDAAHRAGKLVLEYFSASDGQLRRGAVTKSSATDLVTAADRASEELIVNRVLTARPDDGIVGEEGSTRPGQSGIVWVIDPIDGTTNFVYGYPAFSISIAASDAAGAIVGVVHDPLRDETFSAVRGGGSFLNGSPMPGRPTPPPLAESLVATGFGYNADRRAAQAAILAGVLPKVRDIRRGGSAALDLCAVSIGRVDLYYEAGLGRWDREAGVLIAAESGLAWRDRDDLVDGVDTLVVAPPPLLAPFIALLESARDGLGPERSGGPSCPGGRD
jgi:myo-inositol-1(or 4)-monophosphatase